MMRYLFIVFVLSLGLGGFAQPDDAETEVRNGKTYYVHIVEKGNTLYGIHQLYDVPVEDILNANEGMSESLNIGQKIYIPAHSTSSDSESGDYIEHTVSAGETLYGISKKYRCTVGEIKKLNPGSGSGIEVGQVLKVPKPEDSTEFIPDDPVTDDSPKNYDITFEDSLVSHTVLKHETMYSISKRYMVSMDTIMALNNMRNTKVKEGDVLKIPLKKVNYQIIKKDINAIVSDSTDSLQSDLIRKETYNVALMLPFMLDKNEYEMTKTLRPGQEREMNERTKIAYAFYQGFRLAADTLKKAGFNVNLYIYDTKRDTSELKKIFAKPEFSSMDLVIGPLYQNTVSYATEVCREKQIRIVLPFKSKTKHLHKNPYVYNCVASNMTLMDGMIDYVVENHAHHNVILLKPYKESDKALFERARDRFNSQIGNQPNAMNTSIQEYSLGSSSGRDWNSKIRKDTTNIFIVPSTDVKFVSGAMNRMNKVMNMNPYAKNLKVIAFGFEDWNNFNDIDILHRNRMKQHYASYRYMDYNQGRGKELVKAFRAKYGIDPNVFSIQGFDVGLYFMSALHLYGVNFDAFISRMKVDLVQNDFEFEPLAADAGCENTRVCMVMYNNYRLVRMD